MFSSERAAKRYTMPMTGDNVAPRVSWAVQNHAIYSFDRTKHEEYIALEPLGTGSTTISMPDLSTTLALPVTTLPRCSLEVANRCLLALSHIDYPLNALKANVSGNIMLQGVIGRDGALKNTGVAATESDPERLLVNAALKNLRTWRFETATEEHPIRIVYSYSIELSGRPGEIGVRFELPYKVEIRGSPPTMNGPMLGQA